MAVVTVVSLATTVGSVLGLAIVTVVDNDGGSMDVNSAVLHDPEDVNDKGKDTLGNNNDSIAKGENAEHGAFGDYQLGGNVTQP